MWTVYRVEWMESGNKDSRALMSFTTERQAVTVADLLSLLADKEVKRAGVRVVAYETSLFQV